MPKRYNYTDRPILHGYWPSRLNPKFTDGPTGSLTTGTPFRLPKPADQATEGWSLGETGKTRRRSAIRLPSRFDKS